MAFRRSGVRIPSAPPSLGRGFFGFLVFFFVTVVPGKNRGMTTTGTGLASLLRTFLLIAALLLPVACGEQQSAEDTTESPHSTGSTQPTEAPPRSTPQNAQPAAPAHPSNEEITLIDEAGRDFAERRVMNVYDQVSPSVVTITTTVLQLSMFFEPIPSEGTGSGFIVDDEGRVVTNYHVIEGARRVEVTLVDGTPRPARPLGVAPITDLAVLQLENVDGLDLQPVTPRSSEDLEVGQRTIAIGNPFGQFGQSLTTGVVSALDRTLQAPGDREITGVIQTDAAINRGNSGGPLLDSAGRVIGVNTAIFSPTGTSAGIGFAVPVDTVKRVLPELIEFGRYRHPWLGIDAAYSLTEGLSAALGLPVEQGLLLVRLRPGTPLASAGVRGAQRQVVIGNSLVYLGGDILTEIAGRQVTTRGELRNFLESNYPVGEEVEVTIVRDGREERLIVELAEQPH